MLITAELHSEKFQILFYNVENLFDCEDDTAKLDEEYLEGGLRAWNFPKYRRKLTNIAKVIVGSSEWDPPAIVGMCEVESEEALNDLVHTTGLKNLGYGFVHFESPDVRGVDVALLYRNRDFHLINAMPLRIDFPNLPKSKTRDLLYASFLVQNRDTVHFFVCHFPSRLGGELETNGKRRYVASVLKAKIDEILVLDHNANIVVMGDMNDYPTNESLIEVLGAVEPLDSIESTRLYNLMFPLHDRGEGTHKYEAEWGVLDQLIVSGSLIKGLNGLKCEPAEIVRIPFLLEKDEKYFGEKPFRTYNGLKYIGGFSDHLPIKMKINTL